MKNRPSLRMAMAAAQLLLACATWTSSTTAASSSIDVRVNDGRLTADVRDVPLAEVLRIVGEASGVSVTLRGDLTGPITQSFAGVPLEEGIRRLAVGASVMITYGASAEGPGREVVKAIWIVGGGSSRSATTVSPAAPAPTAARAPRVDERPVESRVPWLELPRLERVGLDATVDTPLAVRTREVQSLAEDALQGRPEAVTRLADLGTSETDPAVRLQAVAALGRLQVQGAEPALTMALSDDDAEIRLRAVRGLRTAGTDTSEQSIARVVSRDADPRVRLAALNALASLPGDSMVSGFTRALSDPDPAVRDAAVRGLSWWNMQHSRTR